MSGSVFGEIFRVATFGESHGPGLGAVVDGVPAGLKIDVEFIQHELDRRRPGQSDLVTPRRENDEVEILSGAFDGVATGTPIALLLRNHTQRSSDYDKLAEIFRPGHADRGFQEKFGLRDYRGGGRSSGRETAARVAAGAIAKLFLRTLGVEIRACTLAIGDLAGSTVVWEQVERNPVRAGDPGLVSAMSEAIRAARSDGDSLGGVVGCRISGVPAGWGEPVFDKLDALLAHALFSIGAVKGVEIGAGFAAAKMRGSENNDQFCDGVYATNHAGGVLGGISTGQEIEFRVAVKPTPSISQPQQALGTDGAQHELVIGGRHDPCVVPRIVPVVEAMAALVLADLALRQRAARSAQA